MHCHRNSEITRLNHTYPATGAGTNVYVFYTAKRFDENQLMRADDGLLHELLHAARMGKGLLSKASVGGCFRNREEFLALVVQMVYRSERRLSVFDYTGKPIDPASFLDINLSPSVRELIGALRSQQPVLFSALAKVDGSFNPMRQLAAEAPAQAGTPGQKT